MKNADHDERVAAAYQQHRRVHPGVWHSLLAAISRKAKILEVGCGTGNNLISLCEWAECQGFGRDPSPDMLGRAVVGGVTNETQRVGFTGQIFGGTFTLTVAGETTSALAYEASTSAVLAALEALPNIEPGDVSVTKTQDNMMAQEWTLSFAGNLAGTNVAQSTIDTTSVMGFMITEIEATVTNGGVAYNEVQTVTPTNVNGGFFRLAFQGRTTKPLDHDQRSAVSDQQSALGGQRVGSGGGLNVFQILGLAAKSCAHC